MPDHHHLHRIIIIIIRVTVGVPNCIVTYRVEFGRGKVPVTKMTVAIIKVCKSKWLNKKVDSDDVDDNDDTWKRRLCNNRGRWVVV